MTTNIFVSYLFANRNRLLARLFFCPGSPSLPDKAKHNREVMILLPSHRERANNSMYYNMAENGQVGEICSPVMLNEYTNKNVFCFCVSVSFCSFASFYFFQNNHMQRALLQQVSPCKPCTDVHMTLPEKGNIYEQQTSYFGA